jgi:transposase-like protein
MNTKFSKSFKIQAVKKALMREDGISVKTIANELSIGYSTLQKWIVQTKNHELESSDDLSTNEYSMKHEKRPEDWSSQEKLAVIIKCGALDDNGESQLCREQGIFPHHIKQWTKDIIKSDISKNKTAPATSQMKRKIKLLEKELNRKDKALAETAALLVLQKKVNHLWNQDGED